MTLLFDCLFQWLISLFDKLHISQIIIIKISIGFYYRLNSLINNSHNTEFVADLKKPPVTG